MIVIADPTLYKDKEEAYIKVRETEGRVLTNRELERMPYVDAAFPLKAEWDIRAQNFERFRNYLKNKSQQMLRILDVGCGNGWMTRRLYDAGHDVTGLDLNMVELIQAEQVFGQNERLQWIYADVLNDTIKGEYDIILLSASCQYFPDLEHLTTHLQSLLKQGGEIHLHDSIFYDPSEVVHAKQRTIEYYTKMCAPVMATYYYHHTRHVLDRLGYKERKPFRLFPKKHSLQWWI
jgi:SAM-dependent methyltransferase